MSEVLLEGIEKVYDNGFQAVHELDLQVRDGELLVLVGPSGCGKSTALRMVAGLESITSGTLKIGDRIVNEVPPKDRDIAFVFQNYALYPHMTVRQNIGFALKLRKAPQAEKDARVEEVARLLQLTDYLDRRPGQLSGGQRQRVAMGRAIVRRPQVFLMDEPLSNLDAKLRVQMRAEISRLQHDIGVTTLYVTHDQIEAMTMGSRVAVLSNGRLMQVDTPQRLYDRPDNVFVATFIGSPQMNMVAGTIRLGDEPYLEIGRQELVLTPAVLTDHPALKTRDGSTIAVGIRPEDLEDASLVNGGELTRRTLDVIIELREGLGSEVVAYARLDARAPDVEVAERDLEATLTGGPGVELVARLDPLTKVAIDVPARLAVNVERLHFFDVGTTEAIRD
ncbi:MAG: sn-glycerol-3-phosphate ABC transporter ATP-binding protein UgpC [Actinomycetota bacterium]|nr:sn-glycerol-3-phosphate ABC transporter ATP-binding protein UgpC [Actinomycetota bacterium]